MIKRSVTLLLGLALFLGCASKSNGQADVEPESATVEKNETTEEPGEEASVEVEKAYNKMVEGEFTLEWLVDNGSVHIKLSAPTTGWVALGVAPSSMMKGADFIIGYVADGKAAISDEYGNSATSHKPDTELGGTYDIEDESGWEKEGVTQISFSIPLDSGDKYDKVLEPGSSYKVIFAYGSSDDFTSYHKKKASAKIESL